MAHLIKTNKIFSAIGGEGAPDPIFLDGFYFGDFQGAQYDATTPADIYESQSAASLPSADAGADQIGQNGNDWAEPANDMGSFTPGASATINSFSADRPAAGGDLLFTSIVTQSAVTSQRPDDQISAARTGPPSPFSLATVAVGIADASYPQATFASGISSPSGAAKPVASISQLADYLVNGFWQFNGEIAHHWGSTTITYNISGLTTAEKFLAQSALEAWHEVTNLNFVLTTGTANITFNHNGSMTAFESDSYSFSGIMSSATVDISADWITNDGGAMDGKTGIDSYGYQTYIHEIGHALGLGHQGPYNGSAVYSTDATYADDTWQYSVMSYFSENNYNGGSYRYVITPQLADIYAVDSIYGAATTRTGDTVYGIHDTAGSIYDFTAYAQAPALTIYDSGGTDTLDCSGYSVAQVIDLHPGSFSSVGGLVHNIAIATNAVIEVAIGGSGNDLLIASDLGSTLRGGGGNDTLIGGSGNDTLIGGTGVDRLTGGSGVDTFVFATGDSSAVNGQHDLITDFTTGMDRIDLSGIDAVSGTPGIMDAFNFLGTSAFNGIAGALDYFFDSVRGDTVLQGDTNGDKIADFAIDLSGNIALTTSDFIGLVLVSTVVEANGLTSLTEVGNNFFLYAVGGSLGPELKYAGAAYAAGQFGAWAPIGAEQTTSGYEVAWKVTGADQYTIWNTDSSGNYISNIGVVSGTSSALQSLETSFHQDLNGDGTIGPPVTVIEAAGSTSLTEVGNNFFLYAVGGSLGPELKYSGAAYVAGQFAPWTPIGAEVTASGYEVAWKMTGADQYTVWNTDSSVNYISNIGAVSGTSATLESYETSFHQDLNGDGVIGLPVIEANGSTSLSEGGNIFFLYAVGGSSGPSLKYAGADVVAGEFGAWAPIGAEVTASGYEVAWKMTGADQYTVWNTDSSGNYISNIGAVSGTSSALESYETSFHQDLNGDGTIGPPVTVIEAAGSTSLTEVGNNFYLYAVGGSSGPELKYAGAAYAAGQFGAWAPIGAEQTTSGYEVAWKLTGNDVYTVWNTDSSGNNISNIGAVSGTSVTLESYEASFHQDLNGDGVIGPLTTPLYTSSSANQSGTNSTATQFVAVAIGRPDNDTFIFKPGIGADVIVNATSAVTIELDGFSSVADSNQLQTLLNDAQTGHLQSLFQMANGHDTVINLGNHDSITLTNVQVIDLHATNFIIH